MIQGLWDQHTSIIIDVKLGDADADTYIFYPMETLLDQWEKIKKGKHRNHFHYQRKHCPTVVLSVNDMLERESLIVLTNFN